MVNGVAREREMLRVRDNLSEYDIHTGRDRQKDRGITQKENSDIHRGNFRYCTQTNRQTNRHATELAHQRYHPSQHRRSYARRPPVYIYIYIYIYGGGGKFDPTEKWLEQGMRFF